MGNILSLNNCFNNKTKQPKSMFGRKKGLQNSVPLTIITPLAFDYPIANGSMQIPQIPGTISYSYNPPYLITDSTTLSIYETN